MSLIRIPFLLSAFLGTYATMTPPHGVTHSSVKTLKPTGPEKLATILPFFVKIVYGLMTLVEIAVIFARASPSSSIAAQILTTFIRNDAESVFKIGLSPSFLLGWILNLAGTLIRLKCYQLLGKFFTFELAVHKEHKLITTGPYAVVRHPSYTGAIMVSAGMIIWPLSPGSWLLECSGIIAPKGAFMWFGCSAAAIAGLVSRTRKEDAMLREQFGTRWEEWARNVRYKVVPGVW